MKPIKDVLEEKSPPQKKSKARSQRDEILDMFLERLNPSRKAAGYDPYTHVALATMLKGMSDFDKFALYNRCNRADSFGAYFNGVMRQRRKRKEI